MLIQQNIDREAEEEEKEILNRQLRETEAREREIKQLERENIERLQQIEFQKDPDRHAESLISDFDHHFPFFLPPLNDLDSILEAVAHGAKEWKGYDEHEGLLHVTTVQTFFACHLWVGVPPNVIEKMKTILAQRPKPVVKEKAVSTLKKETKSIVSKKRTIGALSTAPQIQERKSTKKIKVFK
jgi:hypothetical protein